jgi:abortive infection alpha-like protein
MAEREPPRTPLDPDFVRALPALTRLAVEAWWRTTRWTVGAAADAWLRALRAAVSGESPGEVLATAGEDVRDYARRVLGLLDGNGRVPEEGREAPEDSEAAAGNGAGPGVRTLRERGAELLRQSADVDYHEEAHPAYERILEALAPDEGRILRLLALEGPQPSVDVRQGKPLSIVNSQIVAPGLSMIGSQGGCRYLDRVPAYLNNLNRLGLIWFSRESLEDPLRYQVLEAQPDVVEALRTAARGKTVRRSIHLTPFGDDFCRVCLPLETAELDALPGAGHVEPGEDAPSSTEMP